MANKLDRLMLTRARITAELESQFNAIKNYNNETAPQILLVRRETLEELWSEFKENLSAIENTKNPPSDDEFIAKSVQIREHYTDAQVKLVSLTPEETISTFRQNLSFFRRQPTPLRPDVEADREGNVENEAANSTENNAANTNSGDANCEGSSARAAATSSPHSARVLNSFADAIQREGRAAPRANMSFDMTSALNEARAAIGLPANIKLPALTVKRFNGNRLSFLSFRASCNSVLTTAIDEVSRFQYLLGQLDGEPEQLVRHLPYEAGSYAKAWEILNARYDHERNTVNLSLKKLLEIPVSKSESAEALNGMLNTMTECLATIESCKIDIKSWNAIVIFLMSQRLDWTSIKYWEEKIQGKKEIPSLEEFNQFLAMRINVLESTAEIRSVARALAAPAMPINKAKQRVLLATERVQKCTICTGEHRNFKCSDFLKEVVDERWRIIKRKGLCENCLYSHKVEDCTSKFTCRLCGQRHHTLLHMDPALISAILLEEEDEHHSDIDPDELQALEMEIALHAGVRIKAQTVLATATVFIENKGKRIMLKALIDQGSMCNLITNRACQLLSLHKTHANCSLTGINGFSSIKEKAHFTIEAHQSDYKLQMSALVVPSITKLSPISQTQFENWQHLSGLPLADSRIFEFSKIDLLIGAAAFSELLLEGVIKGNENQPIAQQTKIGWIVSGKTSSTEKNVRCNFISNETLSDSLTKFWEMEEIPRQKILSEEEELAEKIYVTTTKRCDDGRYMVKLPFKEKVCLGESIYIAKKRYAWLQKRLQNKLAFKEKYDKCIQEYLDLNHMVEVDDETLPRNYLPHHPVIKESSSSTKIRPVFDASCKTSNNLSLNDQLIVGPTIQPDLFSLLIHWRKYEHGFTGDIEKMYRQVWVFPEDANYQRIIWQPPNSAQTKSFCLKTVTFGVASAAFLAIRTIHQIGENVKSEQPEIAEILQQQFYVDDCVCSTETIDMAKNQIKEVTAALAPYGFNICKWKASDSRIMSDLSEEQKEKTADESSIFKALGIRWESKNDRFIFLPQQMKANLTTWNKRAVLSEIAKLFDPLGWLAPSILIAKAFIQKLWQTKVGWDDQLPDRVVKEWLKIRQQFQTACPITIPRWIGYKTDIVSVSLHGFGDASQIGIAAVVYLCVHHKNGVIISNLVAAKTKVAPIKTISIARLELNAALLVAKLLPKVKEALKIPSIHLHAWSDSTIVLHWLARSPHHWETYVANRTSEIQKALPHTEWRHIESQLNPADLGSRGLFIEQLEQSKLWWHGPDFLTLSRDRWPESKIELFKMEDSPELEKSRRKACFVVAETNPIITRFSSLFRLVKFVARCLKKVQSVRSKEKKWNIEAEDLERAENRLIQIVQNEVFAAEIRQLSKSQEVDKKSSIISLDPYLDKENMLRVGGRNELAILSENEKHPFILPTSHHLTRLIIQNEHMRNSHSNFAQTVHFLRRKYWIINHRRAIGSVIHKCITCFRYKKQRANQKMGNLPAYRVQQALPFTFTGVDYAGYFEIKTSQRRNAGFIKCYIALFTCLTTRAIHLELVTGLSTTQFLKAFKRFIGRRGIPNEMFSDNGTTFIGAIKEIDEMFKQAMSQHDNELSQELLKRKIKWSNIPPKAPHFGGCWESGVKLVKHHLKRVLKEVRLNYEDFETLLIEIEATVNSRPLWYVSTEVDELNVLTPGHFLCFRPLNTLPEPNNSKLKMNRLSQYQYLHRLLNDFWKLWSKEYLHLLQARKKWQTRQPNLAPNQIVLVYEDNLPPTQWLMGKIIDVIMGPDQLVRVAKVQVTVGDVQKIYMRPIHKLSLLPIIDNETEESLIEEKPN